MTMRYALVRNAQHQDQLEAYLPRGYSVVWKSIDSDLFVIAGEDNAGWTLDDYVIPRLASGLIWATELTDDSPVEWEYNRGFTKREGTPIMIEASAPDVVTFSRIAELGQGPDFWITYDKPRSGADWRRMISRGSEMDSRRFQLLILALREIVENIPQRVLKSGYMQEQEDLLEYLRDQKAVLERQLRDVEVKIKETERRRDGSVYL